MKPNRCCCHIIPDVVLDNLKKEGYDIENSQQKFDESVREKRETMAAMPTSFRALAPKIGTSSRRVYSSENTGKLHFKMMRREGEPPSADEDVNGAYENAGIVRDFFKQVLNWNSIDDAGMDLMMNVHYFTNYNNAFWDGDEMIFGDGNGEEFAGFARALDVTGHEMAHGVVQYTANLIYQGQSGALNEHFADVLGTAIKQWHLKQTAQTADWLMGDTCLVGKLKGKGIRSMKSPADPSVTIMPQPDHMSKIYTGKADNGGVHINSGIPNKAFYLVSMEIGTQNAAVLWFEALKLLKASTKFAGLVTALRKAGKVLIKNKTIPANSLNSVQQAFTSVGILKTKAS